ncbi:hypothetical protein ACQPXH_26480 [Nocardia sp. CA-135953]|uniref:hypothetical protein n=1 Tax=Nocardia sp. CA-135953 TaxID=3239978 RepID=UPI003D986C6E
MSVAEILERYMSAHQQVHRYGYRHHEPMLTMRLLIKALYGNTFETAEVVDGDGCATRIRVSCGYVPLPGSPNFDMVLLGPVSTDQAHNTAYHLDGGHVYVGEASNDLNAHDGTPI